jgi:hypothetical protein
LALGILPTIKLTVPQLYIIKLKLPPKINKFITTVYNASVNLLLYQLIAVKTASTYILLINLWSLSQINIAALKVKENRLYYKDHPFIPNLENL